MEMETINIPTVQSVIKNTLWKKNTASEVTNCTVAHPFVNLI